MDGQTDGRTDGRTNTALFIIQIDKFYYSTSIKDDRIYTTACYSLAIQSYLQKVQKR